jgi:hypothetical protein
MNLIIPMAGKSSRFPNLRPKWMLTHPNGRFMAIQAISGLNLEDVDKIYFVCLREHEEQFGFLKGFTDELEDAGLLSMTEFVFLAEQTIDQPQTVYNAIKQACIKGPIVIKDSDNYFDVALKAGNSVCYSDLNSSGLIKPKNKSYLVRDANGNISNIVEKQVISPYFCVGAYSFETAELFCQLLDSLPNLGERYISNVIFQAILQNKLFEAQVVENYVDWGTVEDWERFKRSYATLFVDIDGTLVKNSSSHFPPYIGNTDPLDSNIEILRTLYGSGKFQIILTTSRPEKFRETTTKQMKLIGMPFDHLIMGLFHSKRIIINDYSKSNPFKSCDSINLKRDSSELKDILRESLGVDFGEIY